MMKKFRASRLFFTIHENFYIGNAQFSFSMTDIIHDFFPNGGANNIPACVDFAW